MKILYFSRSYSPHDHRFLAAMVEAGHQPFFLRLERTASDSRALPEGVREVTGKLNSVIQAVGPDLLHAGPLTDCAYQAARSGFHPLVAMSWGSDVLWAARRNPLARLKVGYALRRADAVIGDCDAVRQAVRSYGVADEQILTSPWGIDLRRFNPKGGDGGLRASLGWQENFVLLHLRSWEKLYDPLTVAKAFVFALQEKPELRLLMPGAGRQADAIRRVFANAGAMDQVHLPGPVAQEELPSYYRAANLYISASKSDGSSVSLMEAHASGLPVLVSDIPGNREWVQENENGWLFPIGDVNTLADMILGAVNLSKNVAPLGKKARQIAEKRADWDVNKQQLEQAYQLAMERAAR